MTVGRGWNSEHPPQPGRGVGGGKQREGRERETKRDTETETDIHRDRERQGEDRGRVRQIDRQKAILILQAITMVYLDTWQFIKGSVQVT